jgi:hypothetical protein
MKKLSVICNSYDNQVVYKNDDGILCTLRWGMHDEELPGFFIQSAECLVDIYNRSFYKLDDSALSAFIINMANKIKFDQQIDEIEYIDNAGDPIDVPLFLPLDVVDEEIEYLPEFQIGVCNAWITFDKEFLCNLHEEFLQYLGQQGLIEGFLDLVNVELSLLMKGQSK